jgi:hypothetical protein
MLHYSVEKVPCFVMVNQRGAAIAKSSEPRTSEQMTLALSRMLELARQTPPSRSLA